MNQNNYSKKDLLKGYSDKLFGVHYHDIHRILLPDNEWYNVNGAIEVLDDKYFSVWCIRESDNVSLRLLGNVASIILAEAEYS
tara:strand:+ start:225 stop:473 length:249 start_codon:yes stop_codon:yes gene_type:complete